MYGHLHQPEALIIEQHNKNLKLIDSQILLNRWKAWAVKVLALSTSICLIMLTTTYAIK